MMEAGAGKESKSGSKEEKQTFQGAQPGCSNWKDGVKPQANSKQGRREGTVDVSVTDTDDSSNTTDNNEDEVAAPTQTTRKVKTRKETVSRPDHEIESSSSDEDEDKSIKAKKSSRPKTSGGIKELPDGLQSGSKQLLKPRATKKLAKRPSPDRRSFLEVEDGPEYIYIMGATNDDFVKVLEDYRALVEKGNVVELSYKQLISFAAANELALQMQAANSEVLQRLVVYDFVYTKLQKLVKVCQYCYLARAVLLLCGHDNQCPACSQLLKRCIACQRDLFDLHRPNPKARMEEDSRYDSDCYEPETVESKKVFEVRSTGMVAGTKKDARALEKGIYNTTGDQALNGCMKDNKLSDGKKQLDRTVCKASLRGIKVIRGPRPCQFCPIPPQETLLQHAENNPRIALLVCHHADACLKCVQQNDNRCKEPNCKATLLGGFMVTRHGVIPMSRMPPPSAHPQAIAWAQQ